MVDRGELAALLLEEPCDRRRGHALRKRLSADAVDQLVTDYQAGEGSIYRLADKFGVHRNTIATHLKERGPQLGHQPLSDYEIRRDRELRVEGLSLNAIGQAMGRDPKTVKAAIFENSSR